MYPSGDNVHLGVDPILLICNVAYGAHLVACLSLVEVDANVPLWMRVSEKNQPHCIILALDIISLKFNVILIINFLKFNPKVNYG